MDNATLKEVFVDFFFVSSGGYSESFFKIGHEVLSSITAQLLNSSASQLNVYSALKKQWPESMPFISPYLY
jgi:hypothetical protein